MNAPPDPGRTALYRLYDAEDQLLYVGISSDPETRWRQHSLYNAATWWPLVARKEVEWLDTRKEASKAEVTAIKAEAPLHNTVHVRSPLTFAGIRLAVERASHSTGRAKYAQVADAFREAMATGVLKPGDRLPAVQQTCGHFKVTIATVQKALDILKAEGLVIGRQGAGLWVAKPSTDTDPVDADDVVPLGDPKLLAKLIAERMSRDGLVTLIHALAAEVAAKED